MRKNAIGLLFPGRQTRVSQPASPLRQALQQQLTVATEQPEVLESGIAPFLPALLSAVSMMTDDDIRSGRETMRGIVEALDAAEPQTVTA